MYGLKPVPFKLDHRRTKGFVDKTQRGHVTLVASPIHAEGAVWVADTVHERLLRVAEGGTILDEIKTGVAVFACMLGGDDGRRLFACLAPSYLASEASGSHRASIAMTRVAVPHGGLP
jgi:sugar lactone lactonase YvrE